ncbi:origin recognition complex subunit 1 protein [Dioscorea alata]|uniref:Origin recognition complex subunit 1 protein n=3 Tax=Dioscorea alata TaxID=55571 RepID=A0ACB7UXB4_DIOAL|nr:origin recognition complex subunit 1 protein [Dioscorea alata]KAH7665531.1 origin recognition complex subunit 1 protein [Dioscorea alata]KAH7665532.1 origin recognition complex subunit 1 protein [Dioscorea alata]
MAATPSKSRAKPSPPAPQTPASGPRRSLRLSSTPRTPVHCYDPPSPRKSAKKSKRSLLKTPAFCPITPNLPESKRRRRSGPDSNPSKKKIYFKRVVFDGVEFEIGDDVYVKRKEDAESDGDEPEVEECRICFEVGSFVMVECDDCLGGFHLGCLKPPLKKVPEGDWICGYCEARKMGKVVELPKPPAWKKIKRTAKEKLLSSDLWAARIESLWKEPDGTYWLRCRWYMIPEETAAGRQPHNLRRELYRTNDTANIEMDSVIRHCFVMNPKDFFEANDEGDDVFYCEYEYDVHWHSFKRISEIDNSEECDEGAGNDDEWKLSKDSDSQTDEDSEKEEDTAQGTSYRKYHTHQLAANSRRGRIFGLQRIGAKRIPEHVRCHKQTELERAKAMLVLATLPKFLPCRTKEMEEITAFVKGAICDDQCLGRCLYIHGVPGTGKTMSVLSVMRNLSSEVQAGTMRPYSFIEINGLKLASPENIYKVVYETLSGHRVGWKKALHYLNERFSEGVKVGRQENQPCVLLLDELDLLLTRNQSVLYNVFDWPTRPHSKLVIIGIANTMNLPEKLLPRISSRMGIQRLCFGPYNYQQLQEIILTRLEGIDAFEEQAIEFASRKVAAMSGDARRALEICRRAADLADYRQKQLTSPDISAGKCLVGMADVESAIQEVFQAPHIRIMKTSSRLSKILLVSMVHELYKSGLSEITFDKLAATVSSLCSSNREDIPGWDTLLKVGCKLGECRIILCEEGTKHKLQKLQFNFPSDDVAFALKDCPEVPWLSKYL